LLLTDRKIAKLVPTKLRDRKRSSGCHASTYLVAIRN